MEKPIFYCDCDGVILNTIEVGFGMMREMGCNMSDRKEIDYYFKNKVNWNDIFDKAEYINNSIDQLNYLKRKKIFEDIIILSKVCTQSEEKLKNELFKRVLPDIKLITLDYNLSKALVVPSKDNVLLDDEIRNCEEWNNQEGVAVLFSPFMYNHESNVVNNIRDVVETEGVKKLIKTRYF